MIEHLFWGFVVYQVIQIPSLLIDVLHWLVCVKFDDRVDNDGDLKEMPVRDSSGPTVRLILVRVPDSDFPFEDVDPEPDPLPVDEKTARFKPTRNDKLIFKHNVEMCTLGNYTDSINLQNIMNRRIGDPNILKPIFAPCQGEDWRFCNDKTWPYNRMLEVNALKGKITFTELFGLDEKSLRKMTLGVRDGQIQPYVVYCNLGVIQRMLKRAAGIPIARSPVIPPGTATVIDVFRDGLLDRKFYYMLHCIGDGVVREKWFNITCKSKFAHNKPDDPVDLERLAWFPE